MHTDRGVIECTIFIETVEELLFRGPGTSGGITTNTPMPSYSPTSLFCMGSQGFCSLHWETKQVSATPEIVRYKLTPDCSPPCLEKMEAFQWVEVVCTLVQPLKESRMHFPCAKVALLAGALVGGRGERSEGGRERERGKFMGSLVLLWTLASGISYTLSKLYEDIVHHVISDCFLC